MASQVLFARSRTLRVAIVFALVVGSTFALRGDGRKHRALLSRDLLSFESHRSSQHARVIVKGTPDEVRALAARHGLSVVRLLEDSGVLAATSEQVTKLSEDPLNDVLSGDAPVAPFMDVSNPATAADQVRAGSPGLLFLGGLSGVNGQGVTVAVLDSGVSPHPALAQKIVANVSTVTGDPDVSDTFGHGTHIAGIIAGAPGPSATSLYDGGIAPGVKIINVRVLGDNGSGWTSDVIAGIEWVIANRDRYKIRIINLSLGHRVTEPSTTDPLCRAVQKAVLAGITVVASAGNSGKSPDGAPVLGGITSPGNSPYAITVGALNTKGTVTRSDDVMTTYSSRGPTPYEFAVKPDVVAPGNKIVSLEAQNSYLSKNYKAFHVAGPSTNSYMSLSGTSMSAAIVTGGAALLIQANPGITPQQMKIALQSGASYMRDGGLMGGGAGSVNLMSSRKISANSLSGLVSSVVGGVLAPASGIVYWDAGTLTQRVYSGVGLLSLLQGTLAWLNPGFLQWGDLNLFGLSNPLASTSPNQILWGDVASWSSSEQILWGDSIWSPDGDQILWGDSWGGDGDQILWGDNLNAEGDPQ